MATDPMISSGVAYSINTFTGNGSKTSWDFNFAGGYISPDHVKAYTTAADGSIAILSPVVTGPSTVSITPAVSNGVTLTIYRDTPKDLPVVDFVDSAIINETDLDQLAKQATFASAEMVDRFAFFATLAQTALTQSNAAIAVGSSLIGGDFSKFERTDVSLTITGNRVYSGTVTVPTRTAGDSTTNAASTAFVTSALATAVGPLATAASVTAAISTAAADATTKANAAQAAAIASALATVDPDWLYTLASR